MTTNTSTTMTKEQIKKRIIEVLENAGIKVARDNFNDSGCLADVYPESRWPGYGGTSLVVVYADRVQKYQRDTPYNYTKGYFVSEPVYYNTEEEMVAAVRKFVETPKASCWS
jgi:hypothetical protein